VTQKYKRKFSKKKLLLALTSLKQSNIRITSTTDYHMVHVLKLFYKHVSVYRDPIDV